MHAAIVIPARMGSTRFPGKVLADLNGRPLIQHVYERASEATLASAVIIATDSPEVMAAAAAFGARAVMTRADHASGTDRIAEVARSLDCDIIVNVQGDEPLIRAEVIDLTVRLLAEDPRADMSTVAAPIGSDADAVDPNVVKVALGVGGYALYFSRSPIPYHRDQWASPALATASTLLRHVGIYGYRRAVLLKLAALAPTALEETEKLEQLRALEHGIRIKVGVAEYEPIGVDTPADLEKVRKCLSSSL
jgi:3-deoxy-manno-octulosonate cytidylyltransferase (CMP-KDO synthetase)